MILSIGCIPKRKIAERFYKANSAIAPGETKTIESNCDIKWKITFYRKDDKSFHSGYFEKNPIHFVVQHDKYNNLKVIDETDRYL